MNIEDCKLLLIDDNPGDIRLLKESLRENAISIQVEVAKDGREALRRLGLLAEHAALVKPNLVLLDLNLPVLKGTKVLKLMKEEPETRGIPVVVFSSSEAVKDILESYDNHANCYITKPATLDEYLSVIPEIISFWMSTVQLPA